MKKHALKHLSYPIIYEQDSEGGFVAFAPALPGCHSQGETVEGTEQNVKEAITLYLESLAAHNEPIPVEGRSFSESHFVLIHPGTQARTVVPVHSGRTSKEPLPRAIVPDANLSIDEFLDSL